MGTLIVLLILAFAIYKITTPEERGRFVVNAIGSLEPVRKSIAKGHRECAPFYDALRARTPRAIVTPALVALNVLLFVLMLVAPGALADPDTLIRWGASFGPRTTNGEWWRIITAMFVHSGLLHLLMELAGLVQVGLLVERLVGTFAFSAVYFGAGMFASVVALFVRPIDVHAGAAAAILGIYGLLAASSILGLRHRSNVTVPIVAVKELLPGALLFLIYTLGTADGLDRAVDLCGLVVGLASGLALAAEVSERRPATRRVAATMAATLVIAVVSAVPLRGIANVKPEIEHIAAVEDQLAHTYKAGLEKFRANRMTDDELADLIDETILPQLNGAHARLAAIDHVPHQHQALVASVNEYFRLRTESWHLRAAGLRRSNMLRLREAERAERAALEALQRARE